LEALVADRTKELAKANAGLQRSNEDLQQFAHVASHDLKEPVRKVMTFSSRLKEELGKNISERAATYLSKIEGASARMYAMIDGVLLYSSLNALEQTKELIDLEELMESIRSDLEVLIVKKEATFKYSNLPSLEGSAILIYQLFYNLVNNSLKFAKDGVPPMIEFSAEMATAEELIKAGINDKKQYVRLQLRDNGIGFGKEEAKKIFGTFTRLHPKDKYEGTGLGLSLCRKIVERHGGAIWAEGKEGEGATFTVLLPES
jgi:light-regulated signal transduction histidine kinase (bacteriophytochrome)